MSSARIDVDGWIASEPNWRYRIGEGWEGRFLGEGGWGSVGTWRYAGPPDTAPVVKEVVVKMIPVGDPDDSEGALNGSTVYDEANIGKTLNITGSRHLVYQYGGNRIGDRSEDLDDDVIKIFMEYCPAGDLEQFAPGEGKSPKEPLHEIDIWTIFLCLGLGNFAMVHGTEDINAEAWNGRAPTHELCHFDIKCANILLGHLDIDHPRMPICKIADFGEATWVPLDQDDEYGRRQAMRGDINIQPPEGKLNIFPDPPLARARKGACSNIWQIGLVINSLMLGRAAMPWAESGLDQSNLNDQLRRGPNHSVGLRAGVIRRRYSRTLRELVKECLIREPDDRPTSRALVERVRAGHRIAMDTARAVPQLPANLRAIYFAGLPRPEPHGSWEVDPVDEPADTTGGPFA